MPIDQTTNLIDVALAAMRSMMKLSNLNGDNVSKVVYGNMDIFDCLYIPFEYCVDCGRNSSSFDTVVLITINTSLSTAVVPTRNEFTTMMKSSNTIDFIE